MLVDEGWWAIVSHSRSLSPVPITIRAVGLGDTALVIGLKAISCSAICLQAVQLDHWLSRQCRGGLMETL